MSGAPTRKAKGCGGGPRVPRQRCAASPSQGACARFVCGARRLQLNETEPNRTARDAIQRNAMQYGAATQQRERESNEQQPGELPLRDKLVDTCARNLQASWPVSKKSRASNTPNVDD